MFGLRARASGWCFNKKVSHRDTFFVCCVTSSAEGRRVAICVVVCKSAHFLGCCFDNLKVGVHQHLPQTDFRFASPKLTVASRPTRRVQFFCPRLDFTMVVIHVANDDDFLEQLGGAGLVVVDFTASWYA